MKGSQKSISLQTTPTDGSSKVSREARLRHVPSYKYHEAKETLFISTTCLKTSPGKSVRTQHISYADSSFGPDQNEISLFHGDSPHWGHRISSKPTSADKSTTKCTLWKKKVIKISWKKKLIYLLSWQYTTDVWLARLRPAQQQFTYSTFASPNYTGWAN